LEAWQEQPWGAVNAGTLCTILEELAVDGSENLTPEQCAALLSEYHGEEWIPPEPRHGINAPGGCIVDAYEEPEYGITGRTCIEGDFEPAYTSPIPDHLRTERESGCGHRVACIYFYGDDWGTARRRAVFPRARNRREGFEVYRNVLIEELEPFLVKMLFAHEREFPDREDIIESLLQAIEACQGNASLVNQLIELQTIGKTFNEEVWAYQISCYYASIRSLVQQVEERLSHA